MFAITPVIKKIFWVNIILFITTLLIPNFIYTYFALWSNDNYHIWQLITHQFIHSGFLHTLFNMIALVSIGPFCEEYLGSKKILSFYILCGIGGALLHMLIGGIEDIPMVGASGAVYGLLLLFAFINPNDKLFFMFIPYGIKSKYLISFVLILEVILGLFSTSDRVGHWAHVGGALTGILLYFLYGMKNRR